MRSTAKEPSRTELMSFMKSTKTFFPLAFTAIMVLMCLVANLQAQISVTRPVGSPTLTFDTVPSTNDITMRNVGGGSNPPNPDSPAALDTAVQTNSASIIT